MKFPTFSLLALVAGTRAQLSWKEATSGVTFKVGIPEASAAPFDMIVTFEAPATAGWVGWAAGGCMIRNPIVVAWPDGKGGVTASARWAE